MMLAQLESVAPAALRDFALIIGGLAATAYYLKELFWGGEKIPQPLRTLKEEKFVTTSQCLKEHEEDRKQVAQLRQQFVNLEYSRETQRLQASEDRKTIYKHIDEVRRELSQKIDDMPDRVIATLKNTGAI